MIEDDKIEQIVDRVSDKIGTAILVGFGLVVGAIVMNRYPILSILALVVIGLMPLWIVIGLAIETVFRDDSKRVIMGNGSTKLSPQQQEELDSMFRE